MSINLHLPENVILKPSITVFGAGGAGSNAVNNMIASNLGGVKFVIANTDAQSLEYSKAENKIQLGETITRGLGAGASPEIGRAAAEEAIDEILEQLGGSNMVFITAGMGGGTGTGASPVIAKAAREQGILTVGVVTKPFHFEGAHRMKIAEKGLAELQGFVDTLIVIPNQNLFRIANEKTTFADAFKMADNVLHEGVRGITDLMIMPGLINLDFADIRAVMSEMGKAMMGTGEAEGENRSTKAAEAAISNPLLDNCSMKGAQGVLINITGGPDMTLFEVDEAANRIREEVDHEANIIFGSAFNQELEGKIRVSVVATGIESAQDKGAASLNFNKILSPENKSESEKDAYFNRKNIPTYPNKTEGEVDQKVESHAHEEKENAEEKSDFFFSPPPAEPKATQEEARASGSTVRTEEREVEKKSSGPFGLFGRMASSMKEMSESPKALPNSKYRINEEQITKGAQRELVTEDILDIPAFHRRRKE
jgi:cell division protein FtsZ